MFTYGARGDLFDSGVELRFRPRGAMIRKERAPMDSDLELVELIQDQIEIEKESAVRLAETEQRVGTGAAKLLLVEMRVDSQKHAAVLEAVLKTLKSDPPSAPCGIVCSTGSLMQS